MKWMINITVNHIIAGFLILILVNSCEERIWDNPYDPASKNYYLDTISYGSMHDIENNIYKTVQIGTQIWMAENLKTIRYNNGTSITNVTDNSDWTQLTIGAYCWYNNDINNKDIYGALYNWYTLNTGKLCPEGWHVPSDAEWTTLTNFLGGENVAGGKMKSTSGWKMPNNDATNSSGFSALPGGYRVSDWGIFYDVGNIGCWWSCTAASGTYNPWRRTLGYGSADIYRTLSVKTAGFSVRCIKD